MVKNRCYPFPGCYYYEKCGRHKPIKQYLELNSRRFYTVNIRSKFSETSFLNSETGSGTVVASDLVFEGRITSPNLITVAGSVKGELNASEIVIEKEGTVKGSIFAEHLIVIGNFEGEVSSNKITIASSGSVKGKLSYKRVTIDDGALLDVSFHKI